jgi:hypothetical protein
VIHLEAKLHKINVGVIPFFMGETVSCSLIVVTENGEDLPFGASGRVDPEKLDLNLDPVGSRSRIGSLLNWIQNQIQPF